jgi:hypothetical protein
VLEELGASATESVIRRQLPAWQQAALQQGKLIANGRAESYALTLDPLHGRDGRPNGLLVIAKKPAPKARVAASTPSTQAARDADAFAALLGTDATLERLPERGARHPELSRSAVTKHKAPHRYAVPVRAALPCQSSAARLSSYESAEERISRMPSKYLPLVEASAGSVMSRASAAPEAPGV